jgi:phosphatidylglycerophosphatase A
LKILARVLATWFYCGYAPAAPGTVGSAAAILIAWTLHTYASQPAIAFAFFGAVLAIPGIWAAGLTAREINLKDPGIVVVDEVVGQWITLAGATTLNWQVLLAAGLLHLY